MGLKAMKVYLPHYIMDYHYIANILIFMERAKFNLNPSMDK